MNANPYRGEAALLVGGEMLALRPSFGALVAAEEELGPLFALVERAADGRLALGEMTALFDHLSSGRPSGIERGAIGEAIVEQGLAKVTPVLRVVLGQTLQGTMMDKFGVAASRLAGFAARLLGRRPDEFWAATPAELASALELDAGAAIEGDEIRALLARFPDDEER